MTKKQKRKQAHGGKRPGSGRKCLIPGKTARKTINLKPSTARAVARRAKAQTRAFGHTVTDSDVIEQSLALVGIGEKVKKP